MTSSTLHHGYTLNRHLLNIKYHSTFFIITNITFIAYFILYTSSYFIFDHLKKQFPARGLVGIAHVYWLINILAKINYFVDNIFKIIEDEKNKTEINV